MKLLLLTLSLVGCSLAEAPYPASGDKPQGALLLLPPDSRQPSTTWSSFQDSEVEDLSKLNGKEIGGQRQQADSISSSYHVYLADGRLQKVQYTTATAQPGRQEVQQWNGDVSGNQRISDQYEQGSLATEGGSNAATGDAQGYISDREQLLSESYPNGQISEPNRYSDRQQNFVTQAFIGRQQNGLYGRQQELGRLGYPSESQLSGRNNENLEVEGYSGRQQNGQYSGQESGALNPVIAQFGQLQQDRQLQQIQQLQQRQQQLEQELQRLQELQAQLRPASYVASLRYSNVEPITSPVYSYKPSRVTRVLRYAPQY